MMNVQKYLLSFPTLNEGLRSLNQEFGINSTSYPGNGVVVLNYDQINSPKSHPIVVECRNLILSIHTLGVVSRSFDRFFNYGEVPDMYKDFDISRSVVFEKVDGSLISVYFNLASPTKPQWEISTRSMAMAEGKNPLGDTFRDLVLNAFGCSEKEFQSIMTKNFSTDHTYIFELIGPSNRIVTRYPENQMVLTGIRSLTGDMPFVDLRYCGAAQKMRDNGLNVRNVKTFSLGSFDEILESIKELPTLDEGYVVFDPVSGLRVKIKNPSYVAVHHLRENGAISLKRVYALILENDHAEYLEYFPEDTDLFEEHENNVLGLYVKLKQVWESVKDIEDQKTFALAVKDYNQYNGAIRKVMFECKKTRKDPIRQFNDFDFKAKLSAFL